MKRRDYTETIPERIVQVTDYVAEDGRIFLSPDACLEYEKKLKEKRDVESHPVFKSRRDLFLWPGDEAASLYYFRSRSDYEFFCNTLMRIPESSFIQNDFLKFGPGFYIFVIEDNGDHPYEYRLHSTDYYRAMLTAELDNWKDELIRLEMSVDSSSDSSSDYTSVDD